MAVSGNKLRIPIYTFKDCNIDFDYKVIIQKVNLPPILMVLVSLPIYRGKKNPLTYVRV